MVHSGYSIAAFVHILPDSFSHFVQGLRGWEPRRARSGFYGFQDIEDNGYLLYIGGVREVPIR